MAHDPPVVMYDACVLYPFHLRNLLIQLAVDGLVAARWTDAIHEEWIRNLAGTGRVSRERLLATRDLMKAVLPEADVGNYQRHEARSRCRIQTIITCWQQRSRRAHRSF